MLLLYAADLAFRLRWEIRPALAEGRWVVAVPYVATAVAFGRAAGVPGPWMSNLFNFAPRPAERRIVGDAAARAVPDRDGFMEYGCARWSALAGLKRKEILDRAARHLRATPARRPSSRRASSR